MNGIGSILKQIRIQKNIKLEEVEEVTKIRIKYLQAIEEENFDILPGKVYARGFINTYIRFLGAGDHPEIISIMESSMKKAAPMIEEEQVVATNRKKAQNESKHRVKNKSRNIEEQPLSNNKFVIVGLSIIAVVILLGVKWIYTPQIPQSQDPLTSSQQNEEEIPPVLEETEVEEPEITYDGLEMKLEIVDLTSDVVDKCWTRVTADNVVLLEATLNEGDVRSINATDKITIRVGNGGVAKVTLNGVDLGFVGEKNQVITKEYTLDMIP